MLPVDCVLQFFFLFQFQCWKFNCDFTVAEKEDFFLRFPSFHVRISYGKVAFFMGFC